MSSLQEREQLDFRETKYSGPLIKRIHDKVLADPKAALDKILLGVYEPWYLAWKDVYPGRDEEFFDSRIKKYTTLKR